MNYDKLFKALVIGGTMAACAAKTATPETPAPDATTETPAPEAKTETAPDEGNAEPEATKEATPAEGDAAPADKAEKPIERKIIVTGTNSKGDQCSDVCFVEDSGEAMCEGTCCWLTQTECCGNERVPSE